MNLIKDRIDMIHTVYAALRHRHVNIPVNILKKINKIIAILWCLIFLSSLNAIAQAPSPNHTKDTKVTKQMAQKIKFAAEHNSEARTLVFHSRDNKTGDLNSEMELMLSDTDIAQPIIYNIINYYGRDWRSATVLNDIFNFSVDEIEIAFNIFDDQKRQREIEIAQRGQSETEVESALLKKWQEEGVPTFSDFSDHRLTSPVLTLNLDSIALNYDNAPQSPALDFSPNSITNVNLIIGAKKDVTILSSEGSFGDFIKEADIVVTEPARFSFDHLDSSIHVNSTYDLKVLELINDPLLIKCDVKYDKKNGQWLVSNLYFRNLDEGDDLFRYFTASSIPYNSHISTSPIEAISFSISRTIESDKTLRTQLLNGKHTLTAKIYKHSIYSNNDNKTINCQPLIEIIKLKK